jgi:hypothetical protein
MRVICCLSLIVTAMLGLAGCESAPPPATTQIIVQQPAGTIVPAAPMPPPPPMSELVPPPPPSSTPTIWQPGHWRYSGIGGNPWTWQAGQYVAVPPGGTAWVPGQWQQQGSGWVWREGHWA